MMLLLLLFYRNGVKLSFSWHRWKTTCSVSISDVVKKKRSTLLRPSIHWLNKMPKLTQSIMMSLKAKIGKRKWSHYAESKGHADGVCLWMRSLSLNEESLLVSVHHWCIRGFSFFPSLIHWTNLVLPCWFTM